MKPVRIPLLMAPQPKGRIPDITAVKAFFASVGLLALVGSARLFVRLPDYLKKIAWLPFWLSVAWLMAIVLRDGVRELRGLLRPVAALGVAVLLLVTAGVLRLTSEFPERLIEVASIGLAAVLMMVVLYPDTVGK